VTVAKVILEDLPGPIAKVLEEHNTRLFSSCARAFAAKLAPEVSLPASKLTIPLGAKNHSQPTTTVAGQLDAGSIRYHVRSPFIATSGHGDRFTSVDELEREVRTQAYIHRSAIPTLSQRGIRNTKLLLNLYALDFLTHGQFKVLPDDCPQPPNQYRILHVSLASACTCAGDGKGERAGGRLGVGLPLQLLAALGKISLQNGCTCHAPGRNLRLGAQQTHPF
jgi:hypothetical protein